MTPDVYTLASPSPTLYIYPSQVHPTTPTDTSGRSSAYLGAARRKKNRRRDDELALAVLGAI